jgi:hypothetical protein
LIGLSGPSGNWLFDILVNAWFVRRVCEWSVIQLQSPGGAEMIISAGNDHLWIFEATKGVEVSRDDQILRAARRGPRESDADGCMADGACRQKRNWLAL